jgi:hypothetical protein
MRHIRRFLRWLRAPAHAATAVLLVVCTAWLALGEDDWHRSVANPGADAAYYYAYTPSLLLDGDLDLANQYKVTGNYYKFGKTPLGRPANVFGIGPALFQAPFVAVGHGLALAAGARSDGFSTWETHLAMWASVLFSLGALVVAWRLARRHVAGDLAAYVGAVAVLAAGPVLYYAVRQPGYAHPFATFFAALLVERWDASYAGSAPRSLRTWLVLGGVAGAMVLARPQLAPWGLVCVAAVVDDARRRGDVPWGRLVARWAAAFAASVAFVVPQLVAWRLLYGSWYLVPQGDGFMRWDQPLWIETLFSARNGLFPWAPLYLPCLLGLALVARKSPRLVVALVLGVAAQAVINGAAWDWWGGGSFGGRRFDSCYVAFAVGGAALLARGIAWTSVVRTVRTPAAYARAGVAAAAMCVAALVVVATVDLAAHTSINTARITGGERPDRVWRQKVGGLRGRLAAALSTAASAPVRAVFAWSHDVPFDAYDRLVGVHVLGETFPGLNSYADKTTDKVSLAAPRLVGLTAQPKGAARLDAPEATILVGVNRRGGATLAITWTGAGTLAARWNDEPEVVGVATPTGGRIEIIAGDLDRRINELVLRGTPGIVISPIAIAVVR